MGSQTKWRKQIRIIKRSSEFNEFSYTMWDVSEHCSELKWARLYCIISPSSQFHMQYRLYLYFLHSISLSMIQNKPKVMHFVLTKCICYHICYPFSSSSSFFCSSWGEHAYAKVNQLPLVGTPLEILLSFNLSNIMQPYMHYVSNNFPFFSLSMSALLCVLSSFPQWQICSIYQCSNMLMIHLITFLNEIFE